MAELCGLPLGSRFLLAPMAGVTDRAFRQVCREHGAALCCSEMVSARALIHHDEKTARLLPAPKEGPCALQIFGSGADVMAEGALRALERCRPALIDLNMGCPMPKIVDNGDGCALMARPEEAAAIVAAVRRVSPVPVTVKFRAGPDGDHINAPEFARRMEAAGADALCIHGRTAAQRYAGRSDRAVVAAVKRAVSVPVMASGDALSGPECMEILAETGADLLMIARGAQGNPMIFEDCAALDRGESLPVHTVAQAAEALLRQGALMCAEKGERRAMLELRKHGLWYLARIRGGKPHKAAMAAILTMEELRALCARLLEDDLEWRG